VNQPDADNGSIDTKKPSATIYDIARVLELSPSTVSRALTKPGRVSPATEKRIRDTAAELGYRSNPMARALPTGRTRMLGLVVSDVTNPVFFRLVRGAEAACHSLGYTLVLAESQESAEAESGALDRIKDVVLINRRVADLPAIVPNSETGIAQAIEHLSDLGHTSLVYLAGPASSWMSRVRGEQLFEHAVARGMNFAEIGPNAPTREGGEAALRRVRASGATAAIAYNDLMAIGLSRACRGAGLDVPAELSIVGFDDIFGADFATPSITTVHSPLDDAGAAAVRSLVHTLDNSAAAPIDRLDTRLVIRESTASIR
jgi:LacI family transcriptional regulator